MANSHNECVLFIGSDCLARGGGWFWGYSLDSGNIHWVNSGNIHWVLGILGSGNIHWVLGIFTGFWEYWVLGIFTGFWEVHSAFKSYSQHQELESLCFFQLFIIGSVIFACLYIIMVKTLVVYYYVQQVCELQVDSPDI